MADSTISLRDGANSSFSVKARVEPDGSYAFYHAADSEIIQPDNTAVGMIGTTLSKFSDGFSGPTLTVGQASLDSLTPKWNVVRNTGVTVQQLNGALVITTGTASGNEFLMVGKTMCTIPQNLITTMSMTARSAGMEVRTGYLEVDASGAPVANPNLAGFFNNHTALLLASATTTTATLETLSGGNPTTKIINATGQNASTATVEYALEVRPEDVTYQQVLADSVTAKLGAAARISSMVPSPTVRYAPFFWVRNIATATSSVITIQRIISMDIQELQVEVGGGRGNLAPSQAIPVVQVASGTTQTVNCANTGVTIANAVVSGVANGALLHRTMSAASTNSTLVKAGTSKLVGGILTNTSTSAKFFKIYAKATAPTVGTDVPVFTIPIPANGNISLGTVFDQYGLSVLLGLGYGITGAYADTDATAVAAGDVIVQLIYV